MPRYIDADALDAASFVKGMKHVIRQIDAAPPAHVEPVVHCRECKYQGVCDTGWPCDITDDDDFCSYGKRKDGGSDA